MCFANFWNYAYLLGTSSYVVSLHNIGQFKIIRGIFFSYHTRYSSLCVQLHHSYLIKNFKFYYNRLTWNFKWFQVQHIARIKLLSYQCVELDFWDLLILFNSLVPIIAKNQPAWTCKSMVEWNRTSWGGWWWNSLYSWHSLIMGNNQSNFNSEGNL